MMQSLHTSARTTKLRRATTGAAGALKLLMADGLLMRVCTAAGLFINAVACMIAIEYVCE